MRNIDMSSRGLPTAVLASVIWPMVTCSWNYVCQCRPAVRRLSLAGRINSMWLASRNKCADFMRSVELAPFGRDLLMDFPLMVDQLAAYTAVGTAGRQIVLRTYLPSAAAHNLALSVHLGPWTERPRPAARRPAGGRGKKRAPRGTLGRRLERKISLTFDRATLERALEMLADEVEARVEILGSDLQTEGITKNQSFALDERQQPAREILQKVMLLANPDGKLVYVIRPPREAGGETLVITTRAAAKQRGEALPDELTERP